MALRKPEPGTVTESAKLVASDGVENGFFGWTLSLSGTTGLVGALNQLNEDGSESGVAYLYRDLDTASGTVTESVKLLASDGLNGDAFGSAVSLSGTMALVGANTDGFDSGSAYFFMNLDTASGIATETVKLRASDAVGDDFFGDAVSLSGTTGIVGATGNDDDGTRSGSAYIFRDLDTLSGSVRESVKVTASNGEAFDWLGHSVSLDGDRFMVSAHGADDPSGTESRAGVAYYGSVSSMTVLDESNTSLTIFGLSFDSREDWIVGQTTSGNEVTLSSGDRASVEESEKGVYVGANSGANNNRLTIAGELEALDVFVGGEGNLGNELVFNATSTKAISSILLFPGNKLCIEGEFETFSLLDSWLGDTDLFVSLDGDSELVTQENFDTLLEASFDSGTGFTSLMVTPEEIVEVVISVGEDQRSMLLNVEICFNANVTLGNDPFELSSRESGNLVQLSTSVDNSGSRTRVTLSFSGPLTESSGSLIDGNYQLTVNGDDVTVNGVALDIDGNGTPGGVFVFGDEELHQFYRLFGDVNQSRRVDIFDLLGFRQTYLLMTGDASFDMSFDSNLDGIINIFDLLRFRQNYLKEMPFTSSRKAKRFFGEKGGKGAGAQLAK
jgi:hypothetical protein